MDKTKAAAAIFDQYAHQYQAKYMAVDRYHDSLDLFCKKINTAGARILDVACGPGNITKYLLDQRPDFDLLGIDLSPNMLELAQQNNPSASFHLLDVRAINTLEGPFDGILCGFGLPYLSKEEAIQFIHKAGELLSSGGLLYLSTMEGDYSLSGGQIPSSGGETELYTYYHEAEYLLEALEAARFHSFTQEYIAILDGKLPGISDWVMVAHKW